MRTLTKTGIRVLTKRYRSVLKKCAILNAMVLMFGASPSFAEDVNTWSGLKGAVEGSTEQINVTGNITRGASDEYIIISRTLSIVGTETSRYLSGNGAYDGLAIVAGGNLTLTNINMQNFKIEGSNGAGGAIYNYAASGNSSVESITGNFTSNSISGYAGTGGAIYNYAESNEFGSHIGSIGNITGNFTSNSASLDNNSGAGGAIYNYAYGSNANIGNITGDFTFNSVGSDGSGGAIYNFATLSAIGSIGNITGDFTSNSAGHTGGAICNYARGNGQATLSILATNNKDVTFNGNYMTSASGKGGAIYNHSEDATAIIGLYADANRTITFVGGADETGKYDIDGIYNDSTLNINGNSTDRYTGTVNLYKVSDKEGMYLGETHVYGGTVNVKDTLTQRKLNLEGGTLNLGRNANVGNFYINEGAKLSLSIPDGTFENYENEINTLTTGFYSGVLSDLTVDYDATAAEGSNMDKIIINGAGSGSVAPNSSIKLTSVNVIKDGDTMNNGIFLTGTPAGTLDNLDDVTETITSTTTSGGWKYTFAPSSKGVVSVTREAGKTLAGEIQDPNGSDTFSVNTNPYMTGEDLGSLAGENRNFTINGNGNTIDGTNPAGGKFDGITVGNSSGQEFTLENATMQNFTTAITNKTGATTNINGVTFTNNDTDIANNGTLKLSGTNSISTITGTGTTNIESGVVNATKNITQHNINVKSGAGLNATGKIEVTEALTNNGNVSVYGIKGDIQNTAGGSITFNTTNDVVDVNLTNSGTVNFDGPLDVPDFKLELTQNAGAMNFSTTAIESTAAYNGEIYSFKMNGGLVNIADGNVNTLHINQLNLAGNTNFAMDADLAAESMDKIQIHNVSGSTITEGKVINISKINLLSATTEDKVSLDLFADEATKTALKDSVSGNLNGLQYSPTYIYDAKYSTDDGTITFTRTEQANPYLYAPSSITQTTASITGQISGLAMDKLDVAVVEGEKGLSAGDMPKANNAWVKVMGFDDDVDFKHFNTIDSKTYTLAGGLNTDKVQFADVDAAFGIYGGYIGGRQKYAGNKIDQKGGYIGLSSELTKGNAFLLSTVNSGFINNEAENMYGTDKFDTRWLGVGLKGGYNYALTDTWTLQPNIYAGYTLVNTEDYTSKSGVRINNDNLNFFEIDPGFKLTKQIDNGWLGYIQGKYAIVMDNGGKTTANEIVLPNISAKNYFEYGFGMNKSLTDTWSLNGEINRRDGGRSGWNGSLEFKYSF